MDVDGRSKMRAVIVHYKVKPEAAAENEALVRSVYEELRQIGPAGLRYATFVQEDGVSFVHFSTLDGEEGPNPLMGVAAFNAFREHIADRVVEPPVSEPLREVGSYGFRAN
jgi:hypothetical protein